MSYQHVLVIFLAHKHPFQWCMMYVIFLHVLLNSRFISLTACLPRFLPQGRLHHHEHVQNRGRFDQKISGNRKNRHQKKDQTPLVSGWSHKVFSLWGVSSFGDSHGFPEMWVSWNPLGNFQVVVNDGKDHLKIPMGSKTLSLPGRCRRLEPWWASLKRRHKPCYVPNLRLPESV